MSRSETSNMDAGNIDAGTIPAVVITPPRAQPAEAGQPGRRLRILAALAGITGPLMLAAYFTIPAFVHWPNPAESPRTLTTYANTHQQLFYLGGWLQATGALLSVIFLLVLLQHSGARYTLAGAATLTGCALLLAVVAIEAAMLEAVPIAAAHADHATVATTFALSNGVFARIYPLAPAPLVFAGIGAALYHTTLLPKALTRTALTIAALFLISGLAAVFGTPGLILAIVMSGVEAIWILTAAITFARRTSS